MQLKIMKYTNKYANDYSKTQKKYDWKDLDQTELKAFFSLLIIIGKTKGNHQGTRDLWCSEPLSQSAFKVIMSVN